MKAPSVVLTVVASVVAQLAVARYAIGGRWPIDLVLVGTVYAGVYWGPTAGIWAGTAAGLIQDLLSQNIVGTGALVKTLMGFAAGGVASQFIVTRAHVRVLVVAGATILSRLLLLGLYALIDERWSGVPWTGILEETALNAAAGLLAFQATEMLPGAVARRRMASRSSLSKRMW